MKKIAIFTALALTFSTFAGVSAVSAAETSEAEAVSQALESMSEEAEGKTLSFTTTDLDGNTVKSEDLFSKNKVNVLNVWGTWCPACVAEMGDLAEIETRLQEKGCGMIGIEYEYDPLDQVADTAKAIMKDAGTNYPNVMMPEDSEILQGIFMFPSFVLTDDKGNIISFPDNISFDNTRIEDEVDRLLAGVNGSEAAAAEAAPAAEEAADADGKRADAGAYTVHVQDASGPVKDVVVQFCDDTTCRFGSTGADGNVAFDAPEGKSYDIHLLQVPEGYRQVTEAFHTAETYGETVIELTKE